MKILLVEDDVLLAKGISRGLKEKKYAIDTVNDGLEASRIFQTNEYDLVILDLSLPKKDGWEVLNEIRMDNKDVRVLILSSKSFVGDKIKGLDMGANDYMTKPFDFSELDARIRNLLRQRISTATNILSYGPISMDTKKKSVRINGTIVKLARKEFGILEYLLTNPERVYSSEELMEHVWDGDVDLFSNTFRFHMYSLRKKISNSDNNSVDLIRTIRGVGYTLYSEKNDNRNDSR